MVAQYRILNLKVGKTICTQLVSELTGLIIYFTAL